MILNLKRSAALAALTMVLTVTVVSTPKAAGGDISVGAVCQYLSGTPLVIPCKIYQNWSSIQRIWHSIQRLWTCSGDRPVYTFEPQVNRWPNGTVHTNYMSLVGLVNDSSQSSRVSANMDKARFNTTAGGRWVYMLYADVRSADRGVVKFTIEADRPWRSDENRSNSFGHGQWVWVSKPGSNDCGYYVGHTTGMNRNTFFARNPDAKILMIAE